MQVFYNIEWIYSREQSYARGEMAKDRKLICQALTFTTVLPTYACNPVISWNHRIIEWFGLEATLQTI